MDIKEKLEGYFIDLSVPFESKDDGLWIVNDESKGLENLIVTADDQIVTLTVNVMKTPSSNKEEFFETLLKLNATDLIHGAYGIEGDEVLLVDTLEAATMDLEEIQASLDAVSLALSQHYTILSKYRGN
jgi:hypothetical protein